MILLYRSMEFYLTTVPLIHIAEKVSPACLSGLDIIILLESFIIVVDIPLNININDIG